ncbi:MAG TPA: aspartate-semialdehyde dehydrogenase, partial [Pyrinomonadaceae bacterium]|nr:aspartate-semialdehyde dehydrogenase [Pyrinomonadaceae bacterium]
GILGATGMVGQRFVQLLEGHPQFEVAALAASERSRGKTYAEACAWRLPFEMPASVRDLKVVGPEPPLDCELIFSSLPGDMARETEGAFARAGYVVISNSSAYRMDEDVPLLIPEVNHEHLSLLDVQGARRGAGGGFIVTNPNCSTIMLALALAPLHARFGVEAIAATTMQALSGAGYPGVASLDVIDNVLPFIAGEEEKIESETSKILGQLKGERIEEAPIEISAQCHRVNVSDGHMAAVRLKLGKAASLAEVREALASYTSLPQELGLHSAPERPIIVRDEMDRPQPRLDRDAGRGMSVTIGRLLPDRLLDYRFVVLSHNTVRGAAGAAILNAELLLATGRLKS